MRFARIVLIGAAIWGIVVLTPLYFLVDITGRPYPAAVPDLLLGVLFVAAFAKSRASETP